MWSTEIDRNKKDLVKDGRTKSNLYVIVDKSGKVFIQQWITNNLQTIKVIQKTFMYIKNNPNFSTQSRIQTEKDTIQTEKRPNLKVKVHIFFPLRAAKR